MLLGRSVMMPSQGIHLYLFHCWLDPETRTKCLFPLTCSQNHLCVWGGGGGGGSVIQCPFPLSQTIWKALSSVHLNAYERKDY